MDLEEESRLHLQAGVGSLVLLLMGGVALLVSRSRDQHWLGAVFSVVMMGLVGACRHYLDALWPYLVDEDDEETNRKLLLLQGLHFSSQAFANAAGAAGLSLTAALAFTAYQITGLINLLAYGLAFYTILLSVFSGDLSYTDFCTGPTGLVLLASTLIQLRKEQRGKGKGSVKWLLSALGALFLSFRLPGAAVRYVLRGAGMVAFALALRNVQMKQVAAGGVQLQEEEGSTATPPSLPKKPKVKRR